MLTLPGPIVSVAWLAGHLDHPDVRVADVRWSLAGPPGLERYESGHLPGAVFLDAEQGLSSRSHWSSDPSRPIAVGAER